jgi:hypothetical protein
MANNSVSRPLAPLVEVPGMSPMSLLFADRDRLATGGKAVLRSAPLCMVLLLLSMAASWAQAVRPQPQAPCLYDGRSFSDGARICVQKNLMMTCPLKDERPQWTLVSDKELSSFCLAPTLRADLDVGPPHIQIRRAHSRLALPLTGSSACFTFNRRRYCE